MWREAGERMTPRIGTVQLPEVRLSFAEQGDRSGQPLVLLPGFGDSWRTYERVLPHLPASIRALAPTPRGHGDSSRPESGYATADLAADVASFMDAVGVPSAILVAHSSSCFVAERLALDRPDRVSGLVLLGAPLTLRDNPAAKRLWEETVSKLTDPIDPAFVRDFQLSTVAREVPAAFLETIVAETMKVPARVWRGVFGAIMKEDLSAELPRIDAPTLLVWGEEDAILSRSDQETLLAAIPESRLLVYPGAGHSVHWEEPERVAKDLEAFVRSTA